MREYADEIDNHAKGIATPDEEAALEWARWIRQHAEHTDPINGPLHIVEVKTSSHEELQPHMNS